MAKQAVAIDLRTLKTLVMDFLVFKPKFSRRLSRIFFSDSSRLSRNFRGWQAGLPQIAAGGRISRRLRGQPTLTHLIIHLLHLNNTILNSYSVPSWYSGNRT